jgi:eukaryotic-like serine/threonine-protein kinase
MDAPDFAQRYRHLRSLPPGRAEAVYRAEDAQGRAVQIAVVRPPDQDGFLHTMGQVAAVRHLDLAPVIEAGREADSCYVVSAAPIGTDAAELARRGSLAVADAAMIGAEAAAGLNALHERGLVHGGLDPAAVVRDEDGVVKVVGAGAGTAYPLPDLSSAAPPDVARYLSPEEVAGRAPTAASDVYRAGLVLYLLLTGTHCFDGPDARTVAQQQLDGVVQAPQLRNPAVPPALAQPVLRALDKDPARRGSALQLQREIETVLASAQVLPPPQRPRSKAWIWGLAVLVLAIVAVAAVWAMGREDTAPTTLVTVPDVTGMTAAKAGSVLQEAGLKAGDVVEVQSTAGPAGTVVGQDPAAGTEVDGGTAVSLQVAASPSPSPPAGVVVPDVGGVPRSEAEATLTGAGFVVVVSESASATVAAGSVIRQDPSAGVVAASGSTVRIVVSTGAPSPSPSASASP